MKKNIMLRLSAVLLVAVLLTTCVISGTWAKYTSTGTATDTATVAKWGVDLSVVAPDYNEYNYDGSALGSVQDVNVTAKASAQYLAPGAGLKLANFTIGGTSEVAVSITYLVTIDLGDNWKVDVTDDGNDNPVYYCPLVFKVNDTEIKGLDYDTVGDLETAISTAITALNGNFAPDVAITGKDLAISCYWAFEGTGEQTDAKDTALGIAANAGFTLTVTCTADQIN